MTQNTAAPVTVPEPKKKVPMFDIPFLIGVLALLGVGLLMLFSAGFATAMAKTGDSYYFIRRQALYALLGVVVMLAVSFVPYRFYRRFSVLFYAAACLLLVVVLVLPTRDPEKRWLYLGPIQFQPSEIAKIAVIIFMSDYIARAKKSMQKFSRGVLIPGVIFAVPTLLIAVETHLSGAILVASVGVILIICGGAKIRHLLYVTIPLLCGGIALVLTNSYMLKRVMTWIDPEADKLGDGWQILQSLISIGSGGWFGLGYGKSRQKYYYMSEPQNDFIFSILSEEIGWIGVLFVLALFAFLIWRGIHIAMRAPDTFSSLVVVGIMGRMTVQVLLNLCVVSNTVPVTGISLPFFSYGGTALVVLLGEMGLVLHISRYAQLEKGS